MSHALTKLPRKVLFAILSAILIAVVFVVLALFPRATGIALVNVSLNSIEKIAPADTGALFTTPVSSSWWKTISSLSSPSERLQNINPLDSKLPITRFGYTMSKNHVPDSKIAGPLRLGYIEVTNSTDALKLVSWLTNKSNNGSSFKVFSKDNVVVIAPSWARTYSDVFSSNTLNSNTKYSQNIQLANRDSKVGFSYIDFASYSQALFNTKDPAKAAQLKEFFKEQFSINLDSDIWTGNASAYNTLWYGDLVKGSIDKQSINIVQSKKILSGFQKIISNNNGVEVIDPNEAVLFNALNLNVTGGSSPEDVKNFESYFTPYDKLFSSAGLSQDKSVYRGSVDLAVLNSVMSGLPAQPENIDKILFAASGTKLAFGLVYKTP